MSLYEWAKRELTYAGYPENGDSHDIEHWMRRDVLDLIKMFSEQGHSGMSAPYAVSLFTRLASWKPLSPITGADDEWLEVDDGLWQNKRANSLFKDENGAYWSEGIIFWEWYTAPDIDDGKPYKVYFTSKDSSVEVAFPWYQPDEPEYRFRPSEMFPNEELRLDNDSK